MWIGGHPVVSQQTASEHGPLGCLLKGAKTAAMLFWTLLASGQITIAKIDGWQSLAERPSDQIVDLAA